MTLDRLGFLEGRGILIDPYSCSAFIQKKGLNRYENYNIKLFAKETNGPVRVQETATQLFKFLILKKGFRPVQLPKLSRTGTLKSDISKFDARRGVGVAISSLQRTKCKFE